MMILAAASNTTPPTFDRDRETGADFKLKRGKYSYQLDDATDLLHSSWKAMKDGGDTQPPSGARH